MYQGNLCIPYTVGLIYLLTNEQKALLILNNDLLYSKFVIA